MREKTQALSDDMILEVARRFRLLGEPVRLRLLQALESGEYSVNDLAAAVSGTQANISRHLTAMCDAGLLKRRRDASNVYYSVADPVVFKLCDLICNSLQKQIRLKLDAIEAGQR